MERLNSDTSKTQKIRIVCISDTHNAAPGEGYTLPKGDILIHAGDLTNNGQPKELGFEERSTISKL
jgi:predicted phosphodiesterase